MYIPLYDIRYNSKGEGLSLGKFNYCKNLQ